MYTKNVGFKTQVDFQVWLSKVEIYFVVLFGLRVFKVYERVANNERIRKMPSNLHIEQFKAKYYNFPKIH